MHSSHTIEVEDALVDGHFNYVTLDHAFELMTDSQDFSSESSSESDSDEDSSLDSSSYYSSDIFSMSTEHASRKDQESTQ